MFLRFEDARERGSDESAFQVLGLRWRRRRGTGCDCKGIDEFENEESGERATEVGYTTIVSR